MPFPKAIGRLAVMELLRPMSRRAAIKDMGKAGLAIVVFGAACTSEDPASTTVPSDSTTTTNGTSTTTTTGTSSTTAETTPPSTATTNWARVNLGFVSAYILYRNGAAAVVDTGLSGSESNIEAALGDIGLGWDAVSDVVVTHKHPDHAGSLPAIAALAAGASLYVGAGDAAAIGGVPGNQPIAVGDNDMVFDMEIIETPGHTPGHIAVLDPAAGILVAGDALNTRGGSLNSASADPDFTEDLSLADESVRKMAGLDFDIVLVGHGEPILEDGKDAVSELAASL